MDKKIIIVSNSFWNIFNFRLNLALTLKKKYKVILIAPFDQYTEKLKKLGFACYNVSIDRKSISIFKDIYIIFIYFKLFSKIRPSVILSFTIKPNIYASLVSYFLKIKIINNISGLGTTFIKKNLLTFIVIQLYKLTIKKSFKVFFQNIDDKNYFIENKITTKNNSLLIPGSGIDLEKYKFIRPIINNEINFLYLGRLILDKGLFELFEVIKRIKPKYDNVQFTIIGNIDYSNNTYIRKEVIDYLLKEKLINYLNFQDDTINYISKCSCFILPSYREGLSRSLLEAASIGRPMIASNVPGCKELVIDDYNGFLCNPRDVDDLEYKIIKFINLKQDQKIQFGINSRKIANNYDEKIVFKRYLEVIDEK